MKGVTILLLILAGCSASKEEDPVVIKFFETLRSFPDAGYHSWSNGPSLAFPSKSKNVRKILKEALNSSYKGYEANGPLTKIDNKESDIHNPIYGIQLEKRTNEGKLLHQSILLLYHIQPGDESYWVFRNYDEESISDIKIMVEEGLSSRHINKQNESNQSQ